MKEEIIHGDQRCVFFVSGSKHSKHSKHVYFCCKVRHFNMGADLKLDPEVVSWFNQAGSETVSTKNVFCMSVIW